MKARTILAHAVALAVGVASLAGSAEVAGAAPSPTKTVTYAGYRIEVPSTWTVYRLDDEPGRCIRFDRHAVYLGRPDPEQDCPTDLVGRVDSLLVQPLDAESQQLVRPDAVVVPQGRARPDAVAATFDHEVQVVVESAGLLVTATYESAPAAVERILGSATLTSAAQPAGPATTTAASDVPLAAAAAAGGTKWAGRGFDACTAPSLAAMQAWMTSSTFSAANIYIGGISRACGQPNLTSSWVNSVHGQGWVLIPTYVGLQAPCTSFPNRINSSQAASQGSAAADDAVNKASALGMGAGTPIYFDMENYNNSNSSCTNAVMTFLSAWTDRLHHHGYLSGVYSSVSSGIVDLVRNASWISDPDDIWFANWDNRDTIWGDEYISDNVYANRQRIHQYWGDHDETHGGYTINIDSNRLDADVSGGSGPGNPGRVMADTFANAPGYDAPGGSQTGTLYAGTNYVFCRVWGPEVRVGDSVNHWWLRTDLDVGPANQWVSAVYLSRWGNDEAKDNAGNDIVDCNEPYGAIGAKWRAMGGVNSAVGPPLFAEAASQRGGRFQEFWRGMVIWHSDVGAWSVYGGILGHYRSLESESRWGFPIMDEAAAASSPGGTVGRYQYMQSGLFMWSLAGGTHVIHGAIHDAFAANGREASLGYPTSDEIAHADGVGVYQTYQNATIHWTAEQGTWIVR